MRNVTLILDDGSKFQGQSFGYEKPVAGEVVFNTAMSGYPENLTDPSYEGQILVLTYPLIGNYGVPTTEVGEYGLSDFLESHHIHVSALICSAYSPAYSHWNAKESLGDWLKREEIPAITGIDTRELAKILREKGVMNGRIVFDGDTTEVAPAEYETENFVAKVSCNEVIRYNEGVPDTGSIRLSSRADSSASSKSLFRPCLQRLCIASHPFRTSACYFSTTTFCGEGDRRAVIIFQAPTPVGAHNENVCSLNRFPHSGKNILIQGRRSADR